LLKEPEIAVSLPERKHYITTDAPKPSKPEKAPVPGRAHVRGGRRGRGARGALRGGARTGRTGRSGRAGKGPIAKPADGAEATLRPADGAEATLKPADGAEATLRPADAPVSSDGTLLTQVGTSPAPVPPLKKPPAKRHNLRITPLCKDSNIEISYELGSAKALRNRVLGMFHIKNTTQETIEKGEFTFTNTLNFQLAPHPKRQITDPIPIDVSIAPLASAIIKIPFQYETYTQPQSLTGNFNYSQGHIEFTMVFPCSAFILPEEIDQLTFMNVLRTDAQEFRTTSLNTTLQKATARICGVFRVKVVEEDAEKVSMYGKTLQDHVVSFLVKEDGGREQLAVLIKSNNASLASSLLQELQELKW